MNRNGESFLASKAQKVCNDARIFLSCLSDFLPAGDVLRTEDNYFFAAFSRDRIYLPSNVATPGGGRYVTHLLEEHGRDVWNNILSREVRRVSFAQSCLIH